MMEVTLAKGTCICYGNLKTGNRPLDIASCKAPLRGCVMAVMTK